MKSAIKNILIIVETILIIFLTISVVFLYRNRNDAVETMGKADSDSKDTAAEIERKVNDNYYELSGKKILLEDGTYGEIWIPVLENVPAFSKNIDQIKSRNGRKFYVDDSEITSLLGVDVSVHQDNIDWNKVKESGIDFAMVRLGYRGYGTGEAHLDENYAENIQGARDAGIDAGVYFFSQAVTAGEAVEEANLVIESLEGLDINYPVVYDWEIIYDDTARTDDVSVDVLTDCCVAFCETIKNAGYTPMIYQNKRTTIFKLDLNRLTDYDFWLAEYNSEPTYYYDFDMWQYTSTGQVPGIEGDVDLNISFKDYSK
ncbi:glycoside hydrolase family 25 protein [Porcipelethomonas sp.]|uniref:glycoside hydrolase family 25 protein n=1 Tax=Porcipelethomonas sp. TaxID=2981675 RepID=UPI003EF76E0B